MTKARPNPSAHEVAALAGVSQAAVSRAFTEGASISDRTRSRVLVAARKLGYRPNLLARSLVKGQSNIIGVVLGNPYNPHCIELLNTLSKKLAALDKHMLIFTVEEHCDADMQVSDLLNYRADALLIISAGISKAAVKQCNAANIPIVFLSRFKRQYDMTFSVIGSNAEGGRAVAKHLVQQGYRNLAYLSAFRDSWTNREREAAFVNTALEHGLAAPRRIPSSYNRSEAQEVTRKMLRRRNRPDAVFCASDHIACAVLEVARFEFGLEIGRDLGIVGFDNTEIAAWPSFDFTSFSVPVVELTDKATELILAPDTKQQQYIVPGELHCRSSTCRS